MMEAVQEGKFVCSQNTHKQIAIIPICLRIETLSFSNRNSVWSGAVFLSRDGQPMYRNYVLTVIWKMQRFHKDSGTQKT